MRKSQPRAEPGRGSRAGRPCGSRQLGSVTGKNSEGGTGEA
jgi:hypothetical protein